MQKGTREGGGEGGTEKENFLSRDSRAFDISGSNCLKICAGWHVIGLFARAHVIEEFTECFERDKFHSEVPPWNDKSLLASSRIGFLIVGC